MTQGPKRDIKAITATGIICAMGGYIGGDQINEFNKLEQIEHPYEMAQKLFKEAENKQIEWLQIQKKLYATISDYNITIDSLKRITNQFNEKSLQLNECVDINKEKSLQLNECEDKKNKFVQSYEQCQENEEKEIEIRDDQLDSLEQIIKNYQTAYTNILNEYKNRTSIENEFQAIHNCINAHGENMYSYQYNNQVKCCIKAVKKIQQQYPNNELKDFTLSCND